MLWIGCHWIAVTVLFFWTTMRHSERSKIKASVYNIVYFFLIVYILYFDQIISQYPPTFVFLSQEIRRKWWMEKNNPRKKDDKRVD